MEGEAPLLLSQQAVWAPCGGEKRESGEASNSANCNFSCFCVVKRIVASAQFEVDWRGAAAGRRRTAASAAGVSW